MRSGFSEKYETVGKPLQHKSLVKILDKKKIIEGHCFSQNSVIRFNSDYMDVLGSWYFFKIAAIFGFIALAIISIAMIPLCVLIAIHFFKESILQGLISITLLLIFLSLTFTFLYLVRRDFFHYTYYPIRFNRKERMVYVTEANKTVSSYDWNDLIVTINNPAKNFFYVRLSIVDKNQIVKQTFSLPYVSKYGLKDGLLGHWEFFRSYMEDKTPEKSFQAVKEYYNIHGRKETLAEIFYAVIMVNRNASDNLENTKEDADYLQLAIKFAPILFTDIVVRFVYEYTNKLPPMKDLFAVDEAQYKQDPYNIERKLKNFKKQVLLNPKQKLLLWTWGPCSLILIYLLLEGMTYSLKGETLLLGYIF